MRLEDFFGENYHYLWSDRWNIENNKIWFMAGSFDCLFCLDSETGETSFVDHIPADNVFTFRNHPRCIKINDVIVCLPDNGKDIWCYHISKCLWTTIPYKGTDGIRLSCNNAWYIQGKLYILSCGMKQIIEVDLDKECINKYYDFPAKNESGFTNGILVNGYIYIASSYPANIYKFDTSSKSIQKYTLHEIDDQIQTFCFDGDKFWLTGRCKAFYVWREETKKTLILKNIPDSFLIWNFSGTYKKLLNHIRESEQSPLFVASILVNQYIWLIPFQTNEILYVDKETFDVKVFSIKEEIQTESDVKNQLLRHKYLVEYVKDNRYIGLFSLKNKWVFEIDCKELNYKILGYELSFDLRSQIEEILWLENNYKIFYQKRNVYEQGRVNLGTMIKCMKMRHYKQIENEKQNNNSLVGGSIYSLINKYI